MKNEHSWLFLESKFIEPLRDVKDRLEIGISYRELYQDSNIKEIFECQGIYINESEPGKLYLQTYKEDKSKCKSTKKYLDGIKQSISHLIGLIRGPKIYKKDLYGYPKDYYTGWNKDTKIYYTTILYNHFQNLEEKYNYIGLFNSIFNGANGKKIVDAIYSWAKKHQFSIYNCSNNIEILEPLFYQTLLDENSQYRESLPNKVINFYDF